MYAATLGISVLVGLAAIGLDYRDESCLSAARSTFDAARQAEQRHETELALELYERAIAARGGIRLPWSNWKVATHAHANVAALMLRLGEGHSIADARAHAELALADEPENYPALGAVADSWAQAGDYPAALPYLARVDKILGRPTRYVDEAGRPTFPLPTNAASILPPLSSSAASGASGGGSSASSDPETMAALRQFDGWLRANGAKISPKIQLSFDAKGDGSGLRGVIATVRTIAEFSTIVC